MAASMRLPCTTTGSASRMQWAARTRYTASVHNAARVQARATATSTQQQVKEAEEALVAEASSFYDILGVSPAATKKEIKKAYLTMMKEVHPDRSSMEATEFAALLNEIYETLSDTARRATYDALSGFSLDSTNPFLDTSFERDQVFVDEFACIGCRNCTAVCPSTFFIEEDFGRARVYQQGQDLPDKQQEAIDTCPVSCIHWVSAPQLSLLETAMARMGRVAVWSMSMGSGSNKDVFTEASLAWQKRRSDLLRRRAAAMAPATQQGAGGGWGGWWNNVVSFEGSSASSFYSQAARQRARAATTGGATASRDGAATSSSDDEGAYDSNTVSDRDARGIASLAARAARASRTWKVMQEMQHTRAKARLQIPSLSSQSLSSVSSMDDMQ